MRREVRASQPAAAQRSKARKGGATTARRGIETALRQQQEGEGPFVVDDEMRRQLASADGKAFAVEETSHASRRQAQEERNLPIVAFEERRAGRIRSVN